MMRRAEMPFGPPSWVRLNEANRSATIARSRSSLAIAMPPATLVVGDANRTLPVIVSTCVRE